MAGLLSILKTFWHIIIVKCNDDWSRKKGGNDYDYNLMKQTSAGADRRRQV